MSSVIVGGVAIRVTPSGGKADRFDGSDRSAVFDNSYFVSVSGGARRDFHFFTPPLSQTQFDSYQGVLSNPSAQMCSGDIISIPTMCSPEYLGWSPVSVQGVVYRSIEFVLHESQSAKLLLKYSPGDTITGEAFSRSTAADYDNSGGIQTLAAINVKRDSHYGAGDQKQSLLLEGPATNAAIRSQDFSNAAWTKVNMSVGTGIADPAGGTNAQTLTATNIGAQAYQNAGVGSSIIRTSSMWIRRRTGTGNVQLIAPDGTLSAAFLPAVTWSARPYSATGAANTAQYCGIQLATSGDAVDVWQGQCEPGSFPTSPITTTTVAVTRGTDLYSLPFTAPPSELTVYLKFYELGTIRSNVNLLTISSAAEGTPFFRILSVGQEYRAEHNTGTSVTSTLNDTPALQDTVELCARLFGDGSVDITQSRNGAASTSGAQSAANALATAWSGQLVWLNSEGNTAPGFTAIQSLKIVSGARSLSEMRAL